MHPLFPTHSRHSLIIEQSTLHDTQDIIRAGEFGSWPEVGRHEVFLCVMRVMGSSPPVFHSLILSPSPIDLAMRGFPGTLHEALHTPRSQTTKTDHYLPATLLQARKASTLSPTLEICIVNPAIVQGVRIFPPVR